MRIVYCVRSFPATAGIAFGRRYELQAVTVTTASIKTKRATAYSGEEACKSESRHALIFSRRHTQQSFSLELGATSELHTSHFSLRLRVSTPALICALARISSAITDSSLPRFLRFIDQSSLRLHYTVIARYPTWCA